MTAGRHMENGGSSTRKIKKEEKARRNKKPRKIIITDIYNKGILLAKLYGDTMPSHSHT